MDEVFDNMGGGRNSFYSSYGDGSFAVNGMRFGGNTGITQTHLAEVNYSDEWAKKKISPNIAVNFTNTNTINDNKTQRTLFLPTETTNSNSTRTSINDNKSFVINQDYLIKIDSTFSISVVPRINWSESVSESEFRSTTTDEFANNILNTNDNNVNSVRKTSKISNEVNVYK